jgi:hypothetical protein
MSRALQRVGSMPWLGKPIFLIVSELMISLQPVGRRQFRVSNKH